MRNRGYATFCSRGIALKSRKIQTCDTLYIDSADCAAEEFIRYRPLNPFHFDPSVRIPVPGLPVMACSIESIWQGLKLLAGQTDFAMFTQPPFKRPRDVDLHSPTYRYSATQFIFGDRIVDLITARCCIYIPSYLYLLEHIVDEAILLEVSCWIRSGRNVVFFDWDSNPDWWNPNKSYSHSALLTQWFNGDLDKIIDGAQAHLTSQGIGMNLSTGLTGRYKTIAL